MNRDAGVLNPEVTQWDRGRTKWIWKSLKTKKDTQVHSKRKRTIRDTELLNQCSVVDCGG